MKNVLLTIMLFLIGLIVIIALSLPHKRVENVDYTPDDCVLTEYNLKI